MSSDKLQQLLKELRDQGAVVTDDLRDALTVAMGKLPLVSQKEFDTQVAILERTREKVAALEAQVAELEKALGSRDHRPPSAE
ncbi:Membrane fusogenic activity [Microbulbifer aggregans]|uniref:Membrane fusogenic activity n=1 Tax=Microbulbifer aggregans TaxID=1769779 RepID=A0A1C9W5Y1_9GAMM|nr:accessory factor UbiK family protein [Microbulbifer aggregans]AOS96559.1 Membrane fusogenic activity [Microbulbifer aggregans]